MVIMHYEGVDSTSLTKDHDQELQRVFEPYTTQNIHADRWLKEVFEGLAKGKSTRIHMVSRMFSQRCSFGGPT